MELKDFQVYAREGECGFDTKFSAMWPNDNSHNSDALTIRAEGGQFGESSGKVNKAENAVQFTIVGANIEQREFLNFMAELASQMGLGTWIRNKDWSWDGHAPLRLVKKDSPKE